MLQCAGGRSGCPLILPHLHDQIRGLASPYGPNHDRPARLKDQYDPDNLLRKNHNVEPVA